MCLYVCLCGVMTLCIPVVSFCLSPGDPDPEVTWSQGDKKIKPRRKDPKFKLDWDMNSDEYSLKIKNVQNEDLGEYSVTAVNERGEKKVLFVVDSQESACKRKEKSKKRKKNKEEKSEPEQIANDDTVDNKDKLLAEVSANNETRNTELVSEVLPKKGKEETVKEPIDEIKEEEPSQAKQIESINKLVSNDSNLDNDIPVDKNTPVSSANEVTEKIDNDTDDQTKDKLSAKPVIDIEKYLIKNNEENEMPNQLNSLASEDEIEITSQMSAEAVVKLVKQKSVGETESAAVNNVDKSQAEELGESNIHMENVDTIAQVLTQLSVTETSKVPKESKVSGIRSSEEDKSLVDSNEVVKVSVMQEECTLEGALEQAKSLSLTEKVQKYMSEAIQPDTFSDLNSHVSELNDFKSQEENNSEASSPSPDENIKKLKNTQEMNDLNKAGKVQGDKVAAEGIETIAENLTKSSVEEAVESVNEKYTNEAKGRDEKLDALQNGMLPDGEESEDIKNVKASIIEADNNILEPRQVSKDLVTQRVETPDEESQEKNTDETEKVTSPDKLEPSDTSSILHSQITTGDESQKPDKAREEDIKTLEESDTNNLQSEKTQKDQSQKHYNARKEDIKTLEPSDTNILESEKTADDQSQKTENTRKEDINNDLAGVSEVQPDLQVPEADGSKISEKPKEIIPGFPDIKVITDEHVTLKAGDRLKIMCQITGNNTIVE